VAVLNSSTIAQRCRQLASGRQDLAARFLGQARSTRHCVLEITMGAETALRPRRSTLRWWPTKQYDRGRSHD